MKYIQRYIYQVVQHLRVCIPQVFGGKSIPTDEALSYEQLRTYKVCASCACYNNNAPVFDWC